MVEKLTMLPCPFCGGADDLEPIEAIGADTINAGCERCGATGPSVPRIDRPSGGFEEGCEQSAIRVWNKRAPPISDNIRKTLNIGE